MNYARYFCQIALAISFFILTAQIDIFSINTIRDTLNYQVADSVAGDVVTELDELVIEGKNQRIIKDGVEYVPGKKVRNASYDAFSLLRNLRIPSLNVSISDDKVSTLAGESIQFFINFRAASPQQLQALRMDDVIRVEVLDYPTDPRFKGASHVVNYIVKEYEWGGYTNIRLNGETFQNDKARGALFSQIRYKRMRFYLYGGADIEHSSELGSYGTRSFSDITFNSTSYAKITDYTEKPQNALLQKNRQWAGADIIYTHKGIFIEHTLEFSRTATPREKYNFHLSTSPEIMPDVEGFQSRNHTEATPKLSAYYYFPIRGKNALDFHWAIGTSLNKHHSVYAAHPQPDIVNNSRERTYEIEASASYNQAINDHSKLMLQLASFSNRYNIDYTGSYSATQNLFKSENLLFIQYHLNLGKTFTLLACPGLSEVFCRLNSHTISNQWNPRMFLRSSYSPTINHNIAISAAWGNNTPEPAFYTEAFVRQDYFLWIKGNPNLKNMHFSTASLNYNFIPSNVWSLAAVVKYDGIHNVRTNKYYTDSTHEGLISESTNSGTFYTIDTRIAATTRLVNNSFVINGGLNYTFSHYSGLYKTRLNYLAASISASYFIGNFSIGAYYSSPSRLISIADLSKCYRKSSYGLNITYGYQNIKIDFGYSNWFNKNGATRSEFNSPMFSFQTWELSPYGNGPDLHLTASYTISYGKRQQIYINEEIPSGGSSAILK